MQNSKNLALVSKFLIRVGYGLIFLSIFLFVVFFHQIILQEVSYTLGALSNDKKTVVTPESFQSIKNRQDVVVPVDMEFGVVIPKIKANAPVVANVDPFDASLYQQALAKGVAHAEGTVFPGQLGNSFLFAHSSVDITQARRYNSIFYLLTKLEKGDEFYLTHNSVMYKYVVYDTKVISADDTTYLAKLDRPKTATLMTCWPAGTTFKRFLVIGELKQ